ncbi:hypothetical protein STIAU_7488 [Stigmatella aurantiaca DW4/3-1]|uniref:Uncharacterized protein n=2 Tax=Stigmatella aurantiaca (strain DW4/3-1) TaxID=378806 RepID=Q08YQ5_STIAD|nr:hypothetical protein STIAU_7488 [Stigmatella aurantiaca DW4/3-1]
MGVLGGVNHLRHGEEGDGLGLGVVLASVGAHHLRPEREVRGDAPLVLELIAQDVHGDLARAGVGHRLDEGVLVVDRQAVDLVAPGGTHHHRDLRADDVGLGHRQGGLGGILDRRLVIAATGQGKEGEGQEGCAQEQQSGWVHHGARLYPRRASVASLLQNDELDAAVEFLAPGGEVGRDGACVAVALDLHARRVEPRLGQEGGHRLRPLLGELQVGGRVALVVRMGLDAHALDVVADDDVHHLGQQGLAVRLDDGLAVGELDLLKERELVVRHRHQLLLGRGLQIEGEGLRRALGDLDLTGLSQVARGHDIDQVVARGQHQLRGGRRGGGQFLLLGATQPQGGRHGLFLGGGGEGEGGRLGHALQRHLHGLRLAGHERQVTLGEAVAVFLDGNPDGATRQRVGEEAARLRIRRHGGQTGSRDHHQDARQGLTRLGIEHHPGDLDRLRGHRHLHGHGPFPDGLDDLGRPSSRERVHGVGGPEEEIDGRGRWNAQAHRAREAQLRPHVEGDVLQGGDLGPQGERLLRRAERGHRPSIRGNEASALHTQRVGQAELEERDEGAQGGFHAQAQAEAVVAVDAQSVFLGGVQRGGTCQVSCPIEQEAKVAVDAHQGQLGADLRDVIGRDQPGGEAEGVPVHVLVAHPREGHEAQVGASPQAGRPALRAAGTQGPISQRLDEVGGGARVGVRRDGVSGEHLQEFEGRVGEREAPRGARVVRPEHREVAVLKELAREGKAQQAGRTQVRPRHAQQPHAARDAGGVTEVLGIRPRVPQGGGGVRLASREDPLLGRDNGGLRGGGRCPSLGGGGGRGHARWLAAGRGCGGSRPPFCSRCGTGRKSVPPIRPLRLSQGRGEARRQGRSTPAADRREDSRGMHGGEYTLHALPLNFGAEARGAVCWFAGGFNGMIRNNPMKVHALIGLDPLPSRASGAPMCRGTL